MVTFDDLKPTKRDVVVAVGSITAYKLFFEKWIANTKKRIEAYFDERDERRAKREMEREETRMRYMLEAQKQMFKELVPHLYDVKNQNRAEEQTGKQGEADV